MSSTGIQRLVPTQTLDRVVIKVKSNAISTRRTLSGQTKHALNILTVNDQGVRVECRSLNK